MCSTGADFMKSHIVLDDIDKVLLRQLQIDGRTSYAEMGEMVALTPPAVRARIQKMKELGILQIVAVTDPIALGYSEASIIGIRVDGDAEEVADLVAQIPNVVYMVMSVGGYDLIAELVCVDRDEFSELFHKRIRQIPGVRSADAFPYTRIHTHRFSWGVPQ